MLPVLPYLFGDGMLVDSSLQLLQLCSNGSELRRSHCLTQDLPTVPAIVRLGQFNPPREKFVHVLVVAPAALGPQSAPGALSSHTEALHCLFSGKESQLLRKKH